MKKSTFLFLFLTTLTFNGFAQSKCDIGNHYNDFIQIQKSSFDGNDYLVKTIVVTEKKSCYSDLINNNETFIDYLLTNFSSNSNYQELIILADSIVLRKTFFADLKKDSLFNSTMNELVSKSIEKKISKDTITLDNLLNVAVKYFSIMRINNDGHYMGKVCVGMNDIKKTEVERKPFVEAFCFSSIFQHYNSDEFSMYDEFVISLKELYKVNLGIDKEERLLRAQGAMFLLMRNNENLRKMLKTEYERKKDYLPFVLIG